MAQLSKRLEQIVRKELSKTIIPVKTENGILVGDILITNEGSIKTLIKHDSVLYSGIHLNTVAIKMANLLAFNRNSLKIDALYKADQEYGKWFIDSQTLRTQYQKAITNKDYDRADMLWARYIESRERTTNAKIRVETLAKS